MTNEILKINPPQHGPQMHHWQSHVWHIYFFSQDLGDSVIVIHGPLLVIMGRNFRLLKIVYPLNM